MAPTSCIIYHLTLETARTLPGLLDYLCATFAKEIIDGTTYPQEDMDRTAFENYFFVADVFLGITSSATNSLNQGYEIQEVEAERGERTWEDCIAGFYYVSSNREIWLEKLVYLLTRSNLIILDGPLMWVLLFKA